MNRKILFSALLAATIATGSIAYAADPAPAPAAHAAAKPAAAKMTPAKATVAAKPTLYFRAQTKLKEIGDYAGPVNGKRTKDTVASIEKFQKDKTLKVSGRLTPETVKALGV